MYSPHAIKLSVLAALLIGGLLSACTASALMPKGWITGRATFFGGSLDKDARRGGPTIHEGACHFGWIDPRRGTGWDVAAFPDSLKQMHGACGRCFAVRCHPYIFTDGHGARVNRLHACSKGIATVVVRVTDVCPCHYATNTVSNKRWCCGDMPHIDLSQWAFGKIADFGAGVVGVRFREVPCPP